MWISLRCVLMLAAQDSVECFGLCAEGRVLHGKPWHRFQGNCAIRQRTEHIQEEDDCKKLQDANPSQSWLAVNSSR